MIICYGDIVNTKELVKNKTKPTAQFQLLSGSAYLELFYVVVNDNSTVNYEMPLVTF